MRGPDGASRARARAAVLVGVLAALLAFPPLGRQRIVTGDEARFPLLARNMIERGVWFDAMVRQTHYRNKPPLYPWSIAALALLAGGVGEATAQAPVAAAYVLAVVFTFLLGARLFALRTGIWAALVLATSYGFFQHSQRLLPDMIVVAFDIVASWAFWRDVAGPPARWPMVTFYAALGLAVFAKGPLGLVPLAVAGVWLWGEAGPRGLRRLWNPAALAGFAALTAVWLVPFVLQGPGSFGRGVLVRNWLHWYVGVPKVGAFPSLLIDAVVGLLPWTFLIPLALAGAWRDRRDPATRLALTWFVVPLLLVVLAANQRTRYLLSVYPGAALLVARWAASRAALRTAPARAAGWAALAAVVLAGPALRAGLPPDHFLRRSPWELAPLAVAGAAAGLAMGVGLIRGRPGLLVHGVAGATVVVLGYGIWLDVEWTNRTQPFDLLAARVAAQAPGGIAAVYGGRFFQVDFYLGRYLTRLHDPGELREYLARPERPVVLLPARAWAAVERQAPPGTRVVDSLRVRGQTMLLVRQDGQAAEVVRAAAPGPGQ